MFINTRNKSELEESICKYLLCSKRELYDFLHFAKLKSTQNGYTDGDILEELIINFLKEHKPIKLIESVLFYHLSRRLKDHKPNDETMNLFDLLTTENAFSRFLAKHNIRFENLNNQLEIFHNNQHIALTDSIRNPNLYLKRRLGHNKMLDYCVNGFMLNDRICKNSYTKMLWEGPEFLQALSKLLKQPDLIDDYIDNSIFYCYEYLIPIEKILFDENEDMSHHEKIDFFIINVISRLYDYYSYKSNCHSDNGNEIMRLTDDVNLSNELYISKYNITKDMII